MLMREYHMLEDIGQRIPEHTHKISNRYYLYMRAGIRAAMRVVEVALTKVTRWLAHSNIVQ